MTEEAGGRLPLGRPAADGGHGPGPHGQARPLAMDEPSLGVAPVVVDRLFDVLQAIRKTGLTLLIIEQNVQQTLEMADRGYVMESGQIVLEGAGPDLLQNEHLRSHYLGV